MSQPVDPAEGPRPDPDAAAPPRFTLGYSRYVLGALFVVYIFNFLDRQLLNLFVPQIAEELQVSDTLMGLLTGLAFAAMYTFAGFPLARWADSHSRTGLITVSMIVWSAMTAITGRARTYPHLLLARIGVGEAGFTPAAHSLISDYFPTERRASALAIFSAGASVGTILGFVGGARIAEIYGWRMPFIVLGLAGVPIALLFWATVREPMRELGARVSRDSSLEVVRQLMSRRSFMFLAISASMHGFSSYGSSSWTSAFLVRVHGMEIMQVGLILGLGSGVGASIGQIVAGRVADHLTKRDARWLMWQPAITSVLSLPFVLAFLFSWDFTSALWLYVVAAAISSAWTGPTYATAQSVAPPHMRALAAAILVFMLNLIGLGLGPLIVGALNDLLAPSLGDQAVKYSLMFAAVPHSLAAIFNVLAARTLVQDLKSAAEA